jgi:hypothetical protein
MKRRLKEWTDHISQSCGNCGLDERSEASIVKGRPGGTIVPRLIEDEVVTYIDAMRVCCEMLLMMYRMMSLICAKMSLLNAQSYFSLLQTKQ